MNQKNLLKTLLTVGLIIFLFFGAFYLYQKYQWEKRAADLKYEAEKTRMDQNKQQEEKRAQEEREREAERIRKETESEANKARLCNEEKALECFNRYMEDTYPDWPIYYPRVSKRLDCIYNVTFQTNNPHFASFGGRQETHVVEIRFDTENDKFFFKNVRDVLY